MSLKKVFEPYFKIGTSVSRWNMQSDEAKKELVKHYNSITGENDMKPMFMLDEETTLSDPAKYDKAAALKFDTAIPYLEFAKQTGIGSQLIGYLQDIVAQPDLHLVLQKRLPE